MKVILRISVGMENDGCCNKMLNLSLLSLQVEASLSKIETDMFCWSYRQNNPVE